MSDARDSYELSRTREGISYEAPMRSHPRQKDTQPYDSHSPFVADALMSTREGAGASSLVTRTVPRHIFAVRGMDAYVLKNLFVFLSCILRTVTLYFKADALEIEEMDASGETMVSIRLKADNFPSYKVLEDFPVAVSTAFMNKALSGVKRKDTVDLTACRDALEMNVRVGHKDGQRESVTTIKLQSGQAAHNVFPESYPNRHIVIQSADFQKLCKEVDKKSPLVCVRSNLTAIRFSTSEHSNFIRKEWTMGHTGEGDPQVARLDEGLYDDYSTGQIIQLAKLSTLCSQILISHAERYPLKLSLNVSCYGTLEVLLQSKSARVENT